MTMSPSAAAAEPYVVEDCRGVVQLMSDGTVRRNAGPLFPVDVKEDGSVEWKDAVYEPEHDLNVRLYKLRHLGGAKLPVVAYFHGGGFCIGSRTWPNFHAWCLRLAAELPAVVLSFDYRLAPEHRLPAAQEDGATALTWLRSQATAGTDPWLLEAADFTLTFVAGDSAGGNITHHMAVQFGTTGLDPVQIRGYILLMAAFSGVEPTKSELDTPDTAFLNRDIFDRYGRLSMPVGANTDHPLGNPFGPDSPSLANIDVGDMLVVSAEGDLLKDRNVDYAERLKAMGRNVELVHFTGEEHTFFVLKTWSEASNELIRVIRGFVERVVAGSD